MSTPWSATDRGLLFGRMHEDAAIELEAFPPGGRVFAIASAGCTALALAARGDRVTAVDLNRAQIEYVRARLAGGGARAGIVDRALAAGRALLPLLGVRPEALRAFLELDDLAEQAERWRRLETPALRAVLRIALGRAVLAATPARAFVAILPPRFGDAIRARLARGFARHPNRGNAHAWRLFLGREPPGASDPVPEAPVRLVHAEAVAFLEDMPPASFDGFTLSNVADGADASFRERLLAAVRRCAAPGARYVLRSFADPRDALEERDAARDRAHLWGRVVVARADA